MSDEPMSDEEIAIERFHTDPHHQRAGVDHRIPRVIATLRAERQAHADRKAECARLREIVADLLQGKPFHKALALFGANTEMYDAEMRRRVLTEPLRDDARGKETT